MLFVPNLAYHLHFNVMQSIFELAWVYKFCKIIGLPGSASSAQLAPVYSFFPFRPQRCEIIEPTVIAVYQRRIGFPVGTNLFPPKYRNMHRCGLRIATYEFPPFTIYEYDLYGGLHLRGIDGHVLRNLAHRMNFTRHIIDGGTRGDIIDKNNASGCMALVLNNEVNMTIGNLAYTWRRMRHMRATVPIYISSIAIAVPPGQPYTALQKLLLPFSTFVWATIAVVQAMAMLSVLALTRYAAPSWRRLILGPDRGPQLTTVSIALGVGVTQMPKRNFARFMFLSWMMLLFVLRNTYQGALFYILQRTRLQPRPTTMAGLLAANYTIATEFVHRDTVKAIPQLADAQFEYFEYELDAVQDVWNRTDNVAYVLSTAVMGYYNTVYQPLGKGLKIPTERLMAVPITIYLKSTILTQMNVQIRLMISAGLLDYWYKDMVYSMKTMDSGVTPKPIVVRQLIGLLGVCGVLLVASLLAFVLELVVDWAQRNSGRTGLLAKR